MYLVPGVCGPGGVWSGVWSRGGGCLVRGWGGPGRGLVGGEVGTPQIFFFDFFGDPPRSRLRHMVNERQVRILLECILVFFNYEKRETIEKDSNRISDESKTVEI